ncbi:MAG: hypothetical protein OEV56_03900 [Dehalococcoidia bacterium]|nr:hypothetical protein [Dehalococcoidia bacterium]
MKKIGLICLALVLALGTLGAAFAAWTDTVVIGQTVNTGTLQAGVFAVQRHTEEKDICTVDVTNLGFKFVMPVVAVPLGALFEPGPYEFYDSATIDIGNFYPSIYILEDFVIGVGGTVPVRLIVTPTIVDLEGVYANMDLSWVIWKVSADGVIESLAEGWGAAIGEFDMIVTALQGVQLHGGDVLIIYLDKHLQQTAPQGATASLSLSVKAIQYNEYPL